MFSNYLTIAFRRLRRRLGYTLINVVGLALGMAVCLLIGLYVQDELRFDRFHDDADRILVLGQDGTQRRSMATPYPLAATLEARVPGVERAVRTDWGSPLPVRRPDTQHRSERRVLLADDGFFEVFDFPLRRGEATALGTPDGAVITASMAEDYFGEDDPLGQTLTFERFGEAYSVTVRGVVEDAPRTSTIQFDLVAPITLIAEQYRQPDSWGASMYRTYAKATHVPDMDRFQTQLVDALTPVAGEERAARYLALPLPQLYLSDLYSTDGFRGQTRYLYIFGAVALFILLIACINYVNLATAHAAERAKEVGVRKTMGAGRGQLTRQFLGEALLLCGAALVVAGALTALALPAFNHLFGKALALTLADHGPLLLGLVGVLLAAGLTAGLYPAFVLTRFEPARVLRGAGQTTTASGGWLRRGLVVTQFAISAALIVATAIIYQQLHYVQTKHLGFDGDQVVLLEPSAPAAQQRIDLIAQEARNHAGVLQAAVAEAVPGRFRIQLAVPAEELHPDVATEEDAFVFTPAQVDSNFASTLGLEIAAGTDFSDRSVAEAQGGVLLNETAAEALGWTPGDAVGRSLDLGGETPLPIVGVVEDFHTTSLHSPIRPVVMMLSSPNYPSNMSYSLPKLVAAKLNADDIRGAMDHLEQVLATHAPDAPFEYTFLDDEFDAMYRSERQLSTIFTAFAGLAILIACLGLFGLAAFVAQKRTKEIGIRKVLGASVAQIVGLLSREFAVLVVAALGLGLPVAYLLMNRWLDNFAYRIDIGPGVLALTGVLALLIAGIAVSYHALRAALVDPAESLRYE
ncbi:MAG: FtsX-like permease family protein [Bacteroidetes bacterium]|jgi:putative ABC transport system permease protein|nr:FtsX-like permease family protein [Bacteroidota bacterium]